MIAALLLAAAQSALAGGFPCDLSALPRKPVIALIGENHCDAGSRKVKNDAWARALRGELAVGQEGVYYGAESKFYEMLHLPAGPDSLLFGIEQEFSHGLVMSYFAGESVNVCGKTEDDSAYSSALSLSDNLPYQQAWEIVLEENGGHALLRRSHAARLLEHGAHGRPITKAEFEALNQADFDDMLHLMRLMNDVFVESANEHLEDLGLTKPLVPLPKEVHAPPTPQEKAQLKAANDSIDAVIIPVRNRTMVANLERVYCSVAPTGRQVVAVVGLNHVAGMLELLRADAAGAVEVHALDSEHAADDALQALGHLSNDRNRGQASTAVPPADHSLAAPAWR